MANRCKRCNRVIVLSGPDYGPICATKVGVPLRNELTVKEASLSQTAQAAPASQNSALLRSMVEWLGGSVTTKNNWQGKLSSVTVTINGKSVAYTSKDYTINSDGRAIINSQRILNDFFGDIGTNGSAPPTREQAINYITWVAWYKGVPREIALATAMQESGFTQFKNGTALRGGDDYGMFQINSWWKKSFGEAKWNDVLNNWHRNVDAGMDILADSYRTAKNAGYSVTNMEDLAKATYSDYNGSTPNSWKTNQTVQTNVSRFYDIYANKKW